MTRIVNPRDTWNVIYNARNNRHHTSTSPNAVPATKNDSHHWSSWHMKRHLQCAEQQASPSNLTKYCACHAKWLSWLMSVTHDTSFTMRGATDLILQHHQVLRLPRKMTRIIYPRDIWNVIYNARRNRHHPPTSPNTAPATQNDSYDWSSSHMKRHLQCAEQQASPSNLTKYCACHAKLHSKILEKLSENSWSVIYNARPIRAWSEHDPSMIRPWSDHDPTMNSSSRTRPFAEVTFRASKTHFVLKITTFRAPAIYPDFTEYCACHEKWHSKITKYCTCHEKWFSWLISVTYETSFTMRGATSITLQPHQILRLPRKMALMIDLRHIWNVIYNARSNRHHPPTSPNTAPATQKCTPRSKRNSPRTVEASIPTRGRFDHDPSMIRTWSDHELVISHPPVRRGYFSRFGDAFCIENYNISRSGYLPKFHPILCLPRKMTLQHHQMLRLPRKVTLQDHQILLLPRKVALQMLRLPQKVNCYWAVTQLSCYWAVTQLSCYWTVTQLRCYWTVTELSCYWTVTELSWTCYSSEPLLNCYSTELNLLLKWAVTELLLKWAVTELLLNWAVTDWTVTQLSWTCYSTELLLNCYSSELLLNCYSTELLLNCYSSELLLNWAVIAFLKLRNSEVSHLNFLWQDMRKLSQIQTESLTTRTRFEQIKIASGIEI